MSLLGKLNGNGYDRVRKSMEDVMNLPSYKVLKKNRPNIIPIEFMKLASFDDEIQRDVGTGDLAVAPVLDMDEMNCVLDEYKLELVLRQIAVQEKLDAAKIDGVYETYVKQLEYKHVNEGRKIEENAIVIDSFDGAEHVRSKKMITSVISFSSSLLCSSWINSRSVSAGSSLNILTWQQMKGSKSIYTMIPALETYDTSKKVLRQQRGSRNKYLYYDLHDGKMLYLLTQHSQWS